MFKVNENAPVLARGEIKIKADREAVWKIMADIEAWPTWNLEVKSASIQGELVEGTRFRWKAGPGTITSTLQKVVPPQFLAWTGNTLGIKAVHVWKLESLDSGTLVNTEESWDGLLVRILRGRMQQMLENSINAGLEYLKAEAEEKAEAKRI